MKIKIALICVGVALQLAIVAAQVHISSRPIARTTAAHRIEPRAAAALKVAEAYWGEKADVRDVQFVFEEQLILGHVEGRWLAETHTINLNIEDWDQDHMDAVVTHEYGHALGLGHSKDPYSIMFPAAPVSLAATLPPPPIDWKKITGSVVSGGSGFGLYSTCSSSFQVTPDNALPPLISMKLPEGSCDWKEVLGEGQWTFRIGEGEYRLSGAELSDLIKGTKDTK